MSPYNPQEFRLNLCDPPVRRRDARWPARAPQINLPLPVRRLVARVGDLDATGDWAAEWPGTLITMVEVATAALRASGAPDADRHARAAVVAIAAHIGGTRMRFPGVRAIERMIRDQAIWRAFNGRNTHELAAEYRMPLRTVQHILMQQRRLEQARRRARRARGG